MRIILSTLFIINIAFGASSQLLTEFYSPISTINQSFLGNDYVISNVQYSGSYWSAGVFNATATNLGLAHGIVITTGTVDCLNSGPCGPNDEASSGLDNGFGGNGLLSSLAGGNATFNAAVIEFDFIPLVDSIGLKFVFGSEEYPEYAPPNNSTFNDVFGFFISGPGISGIQNIALLPSGQTVSINNVNAVTNTSYYVNNGNGTQAPYDEESTYIQYDGYTTPLVASKTGLQINSTYHLIIAIADVNDGIYDSGIFIERCSTCSFMLALNEESIESEKKLIGIFDLMGRKTEFKSNTLLIYVYSDGTTEKIFSFE